MFYNAETASVELSIRELCDLAHKSGSIDSRSPYRAAPKNAELCRKWQEKEEKTEKWYRANLPLRNTYLFNGVYYTVEGVADGVLREGNTVTVEELKTAKSRGIGEDAYSLLRCYAWCIAAAERLPFVRLRMRRITAVGEEPSDALSQLDFEELQQFYETLLSRIEPFAKFEILRRTELIPSVRGISFPYKTPREGQSEFAEAVFRAVRKHQRLFVQAPTGIGKTMSALYPAVKAVGEGYCDRIFYLTAKASTRREAYAAAGKLFAAGAKLRTVVLYAKEQMCLCEEGCRSGGISHCNPEDCPFAKGYYDRVDAALSELLARQNGFPRSILTEVAAKHRICPYELSLDLSLFCEIIICDYNYAFDSAVYLRRFFDSEIGEKGKYVFLVDEAHNLPDRARDMYSAELRIADFEQIYAKVEPADTECEKALGGLLSAFRRLSLLCTENRSKNEDGSFNGYYLNRAPLENFAKEADLARKALDKILKEEPTHPLLFELSELTRQLKHFCAVGEFFDKRFLTFIELCEGKLTVKTICLDPSGVLSTALSRAVCSVFFSATLTPPSYFADILGGGKQAISLSLPSPFNAKNLCLTVVPGISTKFEDRGKSYKKIASMIAATASAKAGNYMVYFPSYDYLEKVLEQFKAKYPRVTCIVQQRNMSFKEKEAFLESFQADEGILRIGFTVLGGSFSEGVDLPGSRLIGVVVVGVGIPGLSDERNILRDYYENSCEQGYDYAYTYPGMNHVLQAVGRVIRREEDKGVAVLIDSRYAEEPYLHLYPPHWQEITAAGDAVSLARRLQLFWQEDAQNGKNGEK